MKQKTKQYRSKNKSNRCTSAANGGHCLSVERVEEIIFRKYVCCSEVRDSVMTVNNVQGERLSLFFLYYTKWYPVLRVNNRKDKHSVVHVSRHRTIKLFPMKNLCLELHTCRFPVALCVS